MAKTREIFVCRACGSAQGRWMGKCPDCGARDSLEPERVDRDAKRDPQRGLVEAWAAVTDGAGGPPLAAAAKPIGDIGSEEGRARITTGINELDRVLGQGASGAGLVPGSAVLFGGAPGIGKSTLLLQAAAALAERGTRVLYVTSEESAEQVRARAERLGGSRSRELYILADTNLARIVEQARKVVPAVLIIDSVQMVYRSDLPAGPGSITQLRRCCSELCYLAKMSGIAVVLVGHVTKSDQLAGPRVLEHVVDAVLYFEGDRYHAHRLVRAVKNRYGTTQEIGIFEMTAGGLREVPDGAGVAALNGGDQKPRPGSVVCPVISGTRTMLVELQALTATGFLGAAKRKSSGLDPNRLAMIIAVLEQHAEMRLADRDIFASSVGGVRVMEPAADLALLLAIAGAQFRRTLRPAVVVVGEVGLGGEVRPVSHLDQRIREASRLGYREILVPPAGGSAVESSRPGAGITTSVVKTVSQALEHLR